MVSKVLIEVLFTVWILVIATGLRNIEGLKMLSRSQGLDSFKNNPDTMEYKADIPLEEHQPVISNQKVAVGPYAIFRVKHLRTNKWFYHKRRHDY